MSEALWAKDEDAKQAKKILRAMNRVRNFPTGTCPYSRHTALMAECLVKNRQYDMLLEEPVHCAASMAATVYALWDARAEIERKQECLRDLLNWVEQLPVKHPEQARARERARLLVHQAKE